MNQKAFALDKLVYVQGDPISLEKARGKNAVVVELWATWCPPCRTSIPHLNELQKKYPDVQFVGVSSETEAAVKPFVEKMGQQMQYRVAIDPMGVAQQYQKAFGLKGIPSAVVIDKRGNMVWAGHPMDSAFENEVKNANEQRVLDLASATADSLMSLSVKELRIAARDNAVDVSGCLEKKEMVDKLLQKKKE